MAYTRPDSYTYNADEYCPGCIEDIRYDEKSYDSGDFPKATFGNEPGEKCGGCGGEL